ncbi:hypothetical protein [Microbacterium sp. Se63.02b]|uniref:hypothetical protein n=1 Tax=Microbacterium sp. Se63.02b TaxID=2709304 RepID=UPI001604B843|nr:hypothetical protein [Microbacterium sp. Se63.02b]QNA92682.1 hypothetical protein G4G29_10395 [Microbacterium sp. Se63.02b]
MHADPLHVRPLTEHPDEQRREDGEGEEASDERADESDDAELGEDDDADESRSHPHELPQHVGAELE